MAADHQAMPKPDQAPNRAGGTPAPSGFAFVAKRISTWTTNGVLSALILVAGLCFGRQVLRWWAEDASQTAASIPQVTADGLGEFGQARQIEFADCPWVLDRRSVVGDREAATAQLRSVCRALTPSSSLPPDEVGAAEKSFLDSVSGDNLVDQESGKWCLYALDEVFPMVVGTRSTAAELRSPAEEDVAGTRHRVVTWGLAVPTAERAWTLCTFHRLTACDVPPGDLAEIPLPPNSRKNLSIRASGGGAIVSFGGNSRADPWKEFYDRWLQQHGWTPTDHWQPSESTWLLRYTRTTGQPTGSVDIQFGPDDEGGMTGMLLITPSPTEVTRRGSP